jgi:U3 small nucleolar RNA-associated protein 3
MGKKRKATNSAQKAQSLERSSKLSLNTWEDVADEQDEFLLNRDRILLDEGAAAKRRKRDREEGE